MTPILLKADAKTKIGWLSECTECEVTEERNGVYELELVYPIGATHANEIVTDCYIKAKPNQTSTNQLFHIYKVSQPINGEFTVYAEHVSYILSGYPVPTVSASGNAQIAINAILTAAKNQIGKATGFTAATTDITLSSSINLSNVSARAALGGVQGSVLYTYGGEYEFDNYTIKLHKSRGKDNGVRIAYGKNMTELKCDVDMSASYTGIFGYVKTDDVNLTSSYNVANTSGISTRVLVRDFSSDFGENTPTQSLLDAAVRKYAEDNDINSIKASVTVSFVNLAQSPEYENIAPLEAVNLCDTVKIYHKELGINIKAKVIKTVYDTIAEKYTKIELGSARADMSSIISQTVREATDAKNIAISSKSEITEAYQKAIADATAAITGNSGGYIRLNPSENPQELLIMDTADANTAKKIWRWNLSGLGYSSTGYNGTYTTAITQDGHIVADFIDTGILTANIIRAGIMQSVNGQFSFNLESGHIEASDINITGGNINLSGGSLSIVNDEGYKADLSGGVVDLYQGAGSGSENGYKYMTLRSSLMTSGLSGSWYANIVIPTFSLGNMSSKGLRIGTSGDNCTGYNWDTDFLVVESDVTHVRRAIKTNEQLNDEATGLRHYRKRNNMEFHAAFGAGIDNTMDGSDQPSAFLEVNNYASKRLARLEVYQNSVGGGRLTIQGSSFSSVLSCGEDGYLYYNDRKLAFA